MKKSIAFLLFLTVIFTYSAPLSFAEISEPCYISSTQYYNSAPSQYESNLTPEQEDALLGTVTAKYESNGNPGAISSGNDAGGVSFGAYQFASRAGVPLTFANWCVSTGKATETGNRLIKAYNTDSGYGETFKAEWRALASEDHDGFLAVQHAFVRATYYDAIVSRVEKNILGFDIDTYGIALKNVFWSRSVQHGVGGAYNVISRAFAALGGFDHQSEEQLIRAIYNESGALSETGTNKISGATAQSLGIDGHYMKYYSANPSSVQVSVYRRLHINELTDILNMLRTYGGFVGDDAPDLEAADARVHSSGEGWARLCGFIYNYSGAMISEYGILAGRSAGELERFPIGNNVNSTVISVVGEADQLIKNRAYVGGVYAVANGEYFESELVPFVTGEVLYHTVTFLSYDGQVLDTLDIQNGDSAVYTGDTPTKPADNYFVYTFSGWNADLSCVTQDMTVSPLFTSSQRLYTVTFTDFDGTVLDTVKVPYGGTAAYGGTATPSRPGNGLYRKVFSGWDKDLSSVTADTVCRPIFSDVSYLWDGEVASGFSGGDGSVESPYLIGTAQELALFSALVNSGKSGICARLTDNIVLNHPDIFDNAENLKKALAFTPIGSSATSFSGSFDGNGYKIIGLCATGGNSGLFGIIDGGKVEDLIIYKVSSIGASNGGGLSGIIKGSSAISNVAIYGSVTSDGNGGLLCGTAEGGAKIEDIYCSGAVTANVAGGIGGSFKGVGLDRVFSRCTVSGNTAGGVGGRWQALLSFSLCFFEERGELSDIIAVAVPSSDLGLPSSYHGLTDNENWEITKNGAHLTIDSSNTFMYDVFGDFNLDGVCNAVDAVMLSQFLAGWDLSSDDHNENFDLSGDKKTDVTDSVTLAQLIAGWDISRPLPQKTT
ncbi:MAG: dockerin type I repeat-containing protein [Clostridia bacterium]|nr:dockerin type I repeat-containing protein [Clostridia bacterium]